MSSEVIPHPLLPHHALILRQLHVESPATLTCEHITCNGLAYQHVNCHDGGRPLLLLLLLLLLWLWLPASTPWRLLGRVQSPWTRRHLDKAGMRYVLLCVGEIVVVTAAAVSGCQLSSGRSHECQKRP